MDYSKLILAKGNLFPPDVTVTTDAANHSVHFNVTAAQEGGRMYPDDILYAVIFEKQLKLCILSALGQRSESGEKEVKISTKLDMDSLEIYTFAVNKHQKMSSPSLYLTT